MGFVFHPQALNNRNPVIHRDSICDASINTDVCVVLSYLGRVLYFWPTGHIRKKNSFGQWFAIEKGTTTTEIGTPGTSRRLCYGNLSTKAASAVMGHTMGGTSCLALTNDPASGGTGQN